MTIRQISIAAALLVLSSSAMAQSGTPEEQAACRPDVRRFCYKIKESDGTNAFLACLELHRDQPVHGAARDVLQGPRQVTVAVRPDQESPGRRSSGGVSRSVGRVGARR